MNDSTSNANHATMNGSVQASQQQPGEIAGSVNFEGNTWASMANPANFSFERTDSFSLSGGSISLRIRGGRYSRSSRRRRALAGRSVSSLGRQVRSYRLVYSAADQPRERWWKRRR